jgi:effector-binding domain-containing protein
METNQSTTVAETAENSEEEQLSKYMLLDRLFKFLEGPEDEPINPVLAGYFSKVVQLLVNRKQKQIMPYIVADENKVIEKLLRHVYSRSIAEIIHRLLHIVESNFDDDISVKITEKKQAILTALIEQLKCERRDETVMNATFILQDLMENKSFFQILTRKQNMQKLFDTAFRSADPENGSQYEDSCFETQGLIARFV